MKRIPALLLLAATVACSTSTGKPSAPPPLAAGPAPTPTPGIRSRLDSTVIEETETTVIRKLPKKDYVKVDDRHVRLPILGAQSSIEIFKEDDDYYYVSEPKLLPEEIDARRTKLAQQGTTTAPGTAPAGAAPPPSPGVSAEDFESIVPPVASNGIRLEAVAKSGLPDGGMWRASFVVADMNGDGIPDIVAPPNRIGDGKLHIWLGNGKGDFSAWPLSFTEEGKPLPRFTIDYGAVAVGDLDGDGKQDVVSASHGKGLVALFGDGKGGFRVVRTGLPAQDFSSQAVMLLDADGDGKLDIVASRDGPGQEQKGTIDVQQVRVYLYRGKDGWEWSKEGLVGAFYSNSLNAWDYDGRRPQGRPDRQQLHGRADAALEEPGRRHVRADVRSTPIELYAYHFATAPGTFGKEHAAGLCRLLLRTGQRARGRRGRWASRSTSLRDGKWERHRVWREKDGKASISALAMGDLDGDGLDDVVFADNGNRRAARSLPAGGRQVRGDDREARARDRVARPVDPAGGPGRRRPPRRRALAHGQLFGAERDRWLECLPESSEVTCSQTLGTKLMIGKHKKCFFPLTLGFSGAIIRSIARGPSAPTGTEIRFYEVF